MIPSFWNNASFLSETSLYTFPRIDSRGLTRAVLILYIWTPLHGMFFLNKIPNVPILQSHGALYMIY